MKLAKRFVLFLITTALLISPVAFVKFASAAPTNLIANPSVETASGSQPQSWLQGNWGTNSATFSYLNTGHTGSHSVEVQMANYSSGDAKWYFNPITVTGSTKYAFSDYYESNVSTEVVVQFADASGNLTYDDLGSVAASTSWQQVNDTFTTPANTVNLTVFHLIETNGYLITDDSSLTTGSTTTAITPTVSVTAPTANANVTGTTNLTASASASDGIAQVQFQLDGQNIGSADTTAPYQVSWDSTTVANGTHTLTALATGDDGTTATSKSVTINVNNPVAASTNLITNPLLTTADPSNSAAPLGWGQDSWGTNTPTFSYLSTGYDDSRSISVTMSGYSDGDAKWDFNPINVTPDTQYKFSEYYKSTVNTQVMAVFNMSDGSIIYQLIGLPNSASNWTNFSTTFSIPEGTENMTIYHLIASNGTLTTDDFSLTTYTPTSFKEPLLTLTFDDGYSTTYQYGLPILQQYGYASTQFIISDLVGETGYMTKANLKTLYKDNQEIASHTVTHSDLTQETSSQVTTELSQSQKNLESWSGDTSITDLAYPYGYYDSSVMKSTEKYYTGARGVEDGLNSKDNFNAYDLKVQNVFDTTTTAQVAD
ncbi:MAG: polysaccharide deacetylase family protein [Candidatus Saccharibacteria bacterium]